MRAFSVPSACSVSTVSRMSSYSRRNETRSESSPPRHLVHQRRVEAALGQVEQRVEDAVARRADAHAPPRVGAAPLVAVQELAAVARARDVAVAVDLQQVAQLLVHDQAADGGVGHARAPGRIDVG